jgi:hypothetical protein
MKSERSMRPGGHEQRTMFVVVMKRERFLRPGGYEEWKIVDTW